MDCLHVRDDVLASREHSSAYVTLGEWLPGTIVASVQMEEQARRAPEVLVTDLAVAGQVEMAVLNVSLEIVFPRE